MTIEEKMEHFTSITVQNALKHSADILDEYRTNIDKRFAEHKKHKLQAAESEEKIAIEEIKRTASKEFTTEQLHIRRKHNHKQVELKAKLFAEVTQMLEDYKKTEDYKILLIKYVNAAKDIAGKEEINMYIDESDKDYVDFIEKETGVRVGISELPLFGGVKAEISSRNMLIDNTFITKLEEIKENYIITAR